MAGKKTMLMMKLYGSWNELQWKNIFAFCWSNLKLLFSIYFSLQLNLLWKIHSFIIISWRNKNHSIFSHLSINRSIDASNDSCVMIIMAMNNILKLITVWMYLLLFLFNWFSLVNWAKICWNAWKKSDPIALFSNLFLNKS